MERSTNGFAPLGGVSVLPHAFFCKRVSRLGQASAYHEPRCFHEIAMLLFDCLRLRPFFFFFCSIFQCLVNAPPLARVGALMSCVAAILPDPPSPLCRRTVSPPRPKVYADLHRGAFTCLSPVVLPLLHEENLSVLR